ncbi:hypothetical protein E3N88_00786 [Mikania micrantha]|uniref:Retrovirus-related Pol polyprotein from transposon TNT 1-94-like beta-barrel domain-containing protein n=1 Tax=Mikania micrantha TaxID=192012 RepID=A0A5N6Q1T1_9ASTR|nr:hypothetical protein E3N88_00786 [Mikania micrantha]
MWKYGYSETIQEPSPQQQTYSRQSNNTHHQPTRSGSQHRRPNQGRGSHRGANNNHNRSPHLGQNYQRGPPKQASWASYAQPPWAAPSGQPPYWAPWWAAPPPCPYPTQGWASPWNPPSQRPPSSRSSGPSRPAAQAHVSESDYSPFEPTDLGAALNAMSLDEEDTSWIMDTGATHHLSADPGIYSNSPLSPSINSVFVGNGQKLPILGSGNTTLPFSQSTLKLNKVLYTLHIIKNLISVKQFTIDNFVSVEFDPSGFSVKDYKNGKILTRHNSKGPLYCNSRPYWILSALPHWAHGFAFGYPGENFPGRSPIPGLLPPEHA